MSTCFVNVRPLSSVTLSIIFELALDFSKFKKYFVFFFPYSTHLTQARTCAARDFVARAVLFLFWPGHAGFG